MPASDELVGLFVIECFRLGIESQLPAGTPRDVARVAHGGAHVPRVDLLVKRLAFAAVYRVQEVTDVSLLGLAPVARALLDELAARVIAQERSPGSVAALA